MRKFRFAQGRAKFNIARIVGLWAFVEITWHCHVDFVHHEAHEGSGCFTADPPKDGSATIFKAEARRTLRGKLK
jgi:hypothetical protein